MLSEVVDQIIQRSKEEGHARGHAEGHAHGLRQKARETARRMLVEGISVEVISRITGLTVAEIRGLSQDSDSGGE